MTNWFSLRRVGLLMRDYLAMQRKSLITGFAAIAGIGFGAFLIASASGGDSQVLRTMFLNILLIGGYVSASVSFTDLHDGKSGVHYLMLPGSSLEKYVSRLVLTSIGWVAATIATFVAATSLGALVSGLFFETRPEVFLPTGRALWISIATFLVTQPVFLFGSIYFRKVAFLKTALSAMAVAFSLAVVYLLAARLLFAPAFTGFFETAADAGEILMRDGRTMEEFAVATLLPVMTRVQQSLTWVLVPVFFLVAGVLRLRETEV